MRRSAEIAFSAIMVLVFAYAVFDARGWQIYARLLPWVIGFPMLALALCQLVLDIRKKGENSSHIAVSESAIEIPLPEARRRAISIVAWLLGLFVAIWLSGFSISVPLFTFLYLKIESQESWWLSVLLSALAWAFLFGLFEWTLNLPFPEGELFSWLPL